MHTSAVKLEDPEGTVLVITRIDDAAFTIVTYPSGQPFRMFEDDRAKLREFLKPLVG